MSLVRSLTALLASSLASGCIIKRVDDHRFELRGVAEFVDLEAGWICPGRTKGIVTTLDSRPGSTATVMVPTTETTTYGSCSTGPCTQVTTTSTRPMTVTHMPRKRVEVYCP